MTVTPETRAAVFAPETGEAWVYLVTISHPNLSPPIRVCNNAVDVTSRSNVFVALPFQLIWAQDEDGAQPRARVSLDNISQDIEAALQSVTSPPKVLVEIVRVAAPDVVEAVLPDYTMRLARRSIWFVAGELETDDLSTRPFPPDTYTPGLFPGLFRQ